MFLSKILNFIKTHKIASITTAVILILILFLSIPPKKQPSPSPSPLSGDDQSFTLPYYTQPTDPQSAAVDKAIQEKDKLLPHLPIYVENFQTSVNIPTTINVYALKQDLDYIIHIDIYNLNYHNSTLDESINPDLTAFKESFEYLKSRLSSYNVDIHQLYFVIGGPEFIQTTTLEWINYLELL